MKSAAALLAVVLVITFATCEAHAFDPSAAATQAATTTQAPSTQPASIPATAMIAPSTQPAERHRSPWVYVAAGGVLAVALGVLLLADTGGGGTQRIEVKSP